MEEDGWQNGSLNDSFSDWAVDENSTTFSLMMFQWGTTASMYIQAVIYWLIFIVGVTVPEDYMPTKSRTK